LNFGNRMRASKAVKMLKVTEDQKRFAVIQTLSRHADPYGKPFSGAFPYGKPAHRGVELPQVAESLAHPTSGSLSLRAKDRLRLFRKLFKKVLSKTSFFGQAFFLKLRVNSTGRILTTWLTKLRGTRPPSENSEASLVFCRIYIILALIYLF
jgi:hypothetical protein